MKSVYKTKGQRLILAFFRKHSDTSVAASDVYEYLKSRGETVSLSTIYRRLERMVAEGDLVSVKADDGKRSYYIWRSEGDECDHHLHLQCSICHQVIHLDCASAGDFINHLEAEHSFKVNLSGAILFGVCDECNKSVE